MTYTEAVRFVHSRLTFGSRPGLETIRRITSLCGTPQRGMRFLHIAGTNGKGSVSTMIGSMLTAAGFKTGLYTSPYVIDFRERFQINGQMIDKRIFASLIERLKPIVEQLDGEGVRVTEFELITAAAFLWFREENCDYVVLEVGLGGRFDATNIIENSVCSVIAHIDLDHTHILGDTVAEIAHEKCGVLKPGCPVVVYPHQYPEAMRVIEQEAARRGCPLTVATVPNATCDLSGAHMTWHGAPLDVHLVGEHQVKNAATALAVAERLSLPESAVRDGMARAFIPARQEILSTSPLVMLDGAHNPDGIGALTNALRRCCTQKPTLILGMLADKDFTRAVAELAPMCAHIVTLRVPNPRTLTAGALAKAVRPYCADVTAARSYRQALALAKEKSGGAPVIVAGSLYLAAAIRPHLLQWVKTL